MMRLAAHQLTVGVHPGWEARIYKRRPEQTGDRTHPVIHLANFPLPEERGDFGTEVTDRMSGGDVFVVLFEYGPESAGAALFANDGVPRLQARHFSPARLQRTLPGQVGAQLFFTESGRPFCLYAVVADRRRLRDAVPAVNAALDTLEIA
jgi:hypothetical protein